MFPIDPSKNIRKPKISLCFQGDQKATLGRKRLTVLKVPCHLTHFSPIVKFLYLLKTSENLWLSDVFRGYRNVTLDQDGLILKFYIE